MRPRRNPARWLAPLALVACAVAVYSVVNASLGPDDATTTRSTAAQSATAEGTRTVSERSRSSKRRSRRTRTYTVKPGDTLSSIALKTGLTLERIQQLNPRLDSNALQTGQRVKLSP
ncbi:MAG TPA: LysM domain-containing protein [Solirubrobacteraceae bacterium]|nr:LysM domain-containing protein [Solirubrobacteraceae bacterium]